MIHRLSMRLPSKYKTYSKLSAKVKYMLLMR